MAEVTTVCIDDSAIQVLVVSGRRVRKWASMSLEPGLVEGGVILNEDAVASKVRELWKTQEISAGKVIAAISGINCLYRLLTLPELPKSLLPEAVKREAGRVLGVPLEQVYISWQALPSLKGETLIYLAASPRNSADALISVLRKAQLNPYLMDLRPLAIARNAAESRAIIIDLQPANFDIAIMMEAIPQVVRSLSLSRDALLEEKVHIIRGELDRAITFYNSGHKDKPIEAAVPLLVSGELAQQEDIWKLLVGSSQRPVQALPLPLETPEGFPSSQYTTSIGLALKQLALGKQAAYSLVNFNALPEVYIPKPRPISEILLVPTIIVGIALVVFGAYVSINASVHTGALRAELANVNQMLISKRAGAEEITALSEKASSLEQTVTALTITIDGFKIARGEVNGDLGQINSSLPGVVDLVSVSDDTKTLTVTGVADGEGGVFRYARDLRASGRFAQVVIIDMHMAEQGIGFTLKLTT